MNELDWRIPAPYDRSLASLREHCEALRPVATSCLDGRRPATPFPAVSGDGPGVIAPSAVASIATEESIPARVWLGPFPAPGRLPKALNSTVLVVPTSGSTGTAKAVAHSLASLKASWDITDRALGGAGVWLCLLPPTHIAGIQVLCRSLAAGYEPGLADLSQTFTPDHFLHAVEAFHVHAQSQGAPRRFTSLVPTQLQRLINAATADAATARSIADALSSFDAILVGGAATSPDLLEDACTLGAHVVTTYGSSETAGGCVYDRRPLRGVQLTLRDDRLLIDSPTLGLGYLFPDGHADLFPRPLPTSDLARLDPTASTTVTGPITSATPDVLLTVLGRADDVIISGGQKILPQDVERALATMPGVREATVVGIPDPEWGQAPVALLVCSPEAGKQLPSRDDVRNHLRSLGLKRWHTPHRLLAVEELPRLGIGKIDRSAATDLALSQLHDGEQPQ
ncbi:AMP-binding protein [Devriesea agamarum]|uniref:AMP-binding protein n=1 Tax=Devriesea agamarum TaxID=472569 RepID=UPI000A01D807|nr:AMP-binding protein [Devriesea agamarum]